MSLKLKVNSGPSKGEIFEIQAGLIVGRGQADIVISDGKISNQHARIDKNAAGEFCLVDLGSINGLHVHSKRVPQVVLSAGTKIKIGRVEVEVISQEAALPLPDAPPPIELAPQSWRESLSDFGRQARSKIKNLPQAIEPLKPMVVLRFIRGIQAGTEWVVGYGPRQIGWGSLDHHLIEPGVPPIAFVVNVIERTPRFETEHPSIVRLNGKGVSSETLKEGDAIEIGGTIIKVGLRT